MEQPITLSRILILVGLVVAVLIYAITTGYFEDAEAGTCYGIYCDRDSDGDLDLEEQQEIWEKVQRSRNYIAIQISKSCQISGSCPTYKELADIYDNSDKYLSGDFFFNNSTGLWEREEPAIFNAFELYRFKNLPWLVFVDPDDYTWDRSKQIVIHSTLVYQDSRDIFENQIMTQYVGLKMEQCKSASIGWNNNGSEILAEVMNYFYKKCKGSMNYDPKVEIFINSTIFPDCDRECFFYKDMFKKEIKIDQLLELELWERENCDDEVENRFNDMTKYEVNKEECDIVKISLGEDIDDDVTCYGIYCDRDDDEKDDKDKTPLELRFERLRDLEAIQDCKEEQIWDEVRHDGSYRRTLFDCEDEDERQDYYDVVLCESDGYDYIKDSDDNLLDCYDEDERNLKLKVIRKDIQDDLTPEDLELQLEIQECSDFVDYELTLSDRRNRALIVECEDKDDREEYMQEIKLLYPEGLPEEYKTKLEEDKPKVRCYGIYCDKNKK